ncbi:MAG: sirohydrochlorin chelatase [Mycobacterium sp.]
MRAAQLVSSTLVLTAHGSADPRSAATTREIAQRIRLMRPRQEVRVAFCERSTPNLRDVLAALRGPAGITPVVTPLLLASAYHARIDIPAMIRDAESPAVRAATLGEDPRLVSVMRERLSALGIRPSDEGVGVLVVAVGSSHAAANARTATVAVEVARGTSWSTATAYATGPYSGVAREIELMRRRDLQRIVLAPWFIAPGIITDRVAALADAAGIEMAEPLGSHRSVARTVLDRFDQAISARAAA